MLARLIAYARGLLTRGRVDREVDDELRFHLDQEIDANLSRGMSPAEARRMALADLGGLTRTADAVRAIRSTGLSRVSIDLRDALRGLRAGRGTTALAFGTLALTMAAGTVTFSVVDAVAIRPLPYGSPERLVDFALPSATPGRVTLANPQAYFSWREGTQSFESIGAARPTSLTLGTSDATVELRAYRTTANLFDVLGVRPLIGRLFGPEHGRPGGPPAVILSHDLWVSRFGADPAVVGRRLAFEDVRRDVVGVLAAGVSFSIRSGAPPDVYLPYVMTEADRTNSRCCVFVVGRLRPGVSVEQARADVQRMSSAVVEPLHDRVVGPAKTWLLLVLAAVGLVLLVACANVAGLLLARGTTRARELATREAMGASPRRLATVLLLEGLTLSLASAAAGVALSFWGVEVARSLLPPGLARVSAIAVDGRVLSVSVLVAALCGILSASAPAWKTVRTDLLERMRASGGAVIGGRRSTRALSAFLVADVAFVSVLLVATTLVVSSFIVITTADLGFDRHNVMSVWFTRTLNDVPEAERQVAVRTFRTDLVRRAASAPGATHAAISTVGPPLNGTSNGVRLIIPGFGATTGFDIDTRSVSHDYFAVMGMRLIQGRLFTPIDRVGTARVAVINEAAQKRFFPDRDPIGETVAYQHPPPGPTTIIGVVQSTWVDGPEADVRPEMYTLLNQQPYHDINSPARGGLITVGGLVVRTDRDPRSVAPAVREAIRPALLGREPAETTFVNDSFVRITAGRRLNAGVMAVFGLIALAIGAIGVYGTMAFVVAQHGRAIGLRMALGATPAAVGRSVLREALGRVGLGAAVGLVGAWMASSTLEAFVFGMRPTEPLVYVTVGGFLALVGLAAALVPAARAARVDPLTVLRSE